jgi:hypothetical protein
VAHTVGGPAPHQFRRPAANAAPQARARHFHGDPTAGRRLEQATARATPTRSQFEEVRAHLRSVERRLDQAKLEAAAPRRHFGAGSVLPAIAKKPATRIELLRDRLEHNLLRVSTVLFVAGVVGWSLLIVNQFRSPVLATQSGAAVAKSDSEFGQSDPSAPKVAERRAKAPAKPVAKEAKLSPTRPPIRLASLEGAEPAPPVIPSRIPPNVGSLTNLVDFETAPFPYHGMTPGSGRPFLNAGEDGHRGHTNFRGHSLWESQTFSDDRVLLHIPPGFDPRRPAVIVVFFHGHGATLARDVRDRQQVPAQITAAGANAVLVAPQFAVDAADSSAGKFWEVNGFKRFLDEAAVKLAYMYGDPRSAMIFAKMPIVIVSYSGGFGPTLSVLDRGGVRSRVRGVVMLDSLYGGIDKFADWIAANRSTFFVSSYTPHTAHHNASLEQLLRERSVPYSSELRRGHLDGMVTFLPAGPVSHRDFVTHAWSDNPVEDILARMDDVDPRIEAAATTASIPASAATRN